ncbi:anti-sigma factor antagonist [Pseudonocardia sp. KRD-169]|uniref:Anti-sigma factor antagonist n=2 Tax=Pseudonocardia abyssalis TaxID=2792008 RepID=A0ABS6UV68_9PSEU|nr:anti-sigma factor antagonist [Pseudonocardia abyssalis]MBW0135629.1 anti-sigma factor antagonist [Pseudonocardia abyssalis]
MTIDRAEVRGFVVVHVRGEVDALTVDRLGDAVTTALGGGRPVVIDLTDVRFLDSAGLATLVRVTQESEDRGEPLRIAVDENRPVVRPIEITGLEGVLALYDSVDDATAAPA